MENAKTFCVVEIRTVANGFVVMPPLENDHGLRNMTEEVFAFQTFEAVTDFLKTRLQQPKEKKNA